MLLVCHCSVRPTNSPHSFSSYTSFTQLMTCAHRQHRILERLDTLNLGGNRRLEKVVVSRATDNRQRRSSAASVSHDVINDVRSCHCSQGSKVICSLVISQNKVIVLSKFSLMKYFIIHLYIHIKICTPTYSCELSTFIIVAAVSDNKYKISCIYGKECKIQLIPVDLYIWWL